MTSRRLLVPVLALLLGVQIFRNSAVAGMTERDPDFAARIWPGHPDVEISRAMTEIGGLATRVKPVPPSAFATMESAARKAPLAPEPFLVLGAQAQLSGDQSRSLQAFSAAVARDPGSPAAHYLLAGALLRAGEAVRGLREIDLVARLAPAEVANVVPFVAAYAKDRENWLQLRELFVSNPVLERTVLSVLAADASNTDTVLALANKRVRAPRWLPILLNSLVAARQYGRARAIWASAAQARSASDRLYDGEFTEAKAPAPFNWVLVSSIVGRAERGARGGLHVVFYGREDGLLARQLLLLPPGGYRISMEMAATARDAHALTWSVRCDGRAGPIAAIPLDVARSRSWRFAVPADCPAQWIELSGVSTNAARQSEATIQNMRLVPERPNG
jgi:hypothetical protein